MRLSGYSPDVDSAYILEAAGRFHGHIGPWLALGVRAGLLAKARLQASHFGLMADVRCPDGTPYTCFLDGVQFSSGCTMGKGNISHHVANGCSVAFRTADATESRRNLVLEVAPGLWAELHENRRLGDRQVTLLGYEVFGRPTELLFHERWESEDGETGGTEPESNGA